MAIQAVLLDLDDTILDENPGRAAARQLVMDSLCRSYPFVDPVAVGLVLDQTNQHFWSSPRRHAWGRKNMPAARWLVLTHVLIKFGISETDIVEGLLDRYMALRDAQMIFCPGAVVALKLLRRTYPKLGLLTNGGGRAQRAKITRFQLETYFDHIQVEEEFGKGKPDPAAFGNVLAKLEVPPEAAVMVGNDWQADIIPALRLNMRAVHIDAANSATEKLPAGCRRVAFLGDVPAVLEEM